MHMIMKSWTLKKMRKSFEYQDLSDAVDLVVHTKSPSKWLLIDRETGQTFQGSKTGKWDRLDPVLKKDE
jgi:hypothetical protein